MHIVYWSDLFWPYLGGVETQAAQILPALAERGLKFTVITSHRDLALPDREDWNGATIRRFPFRKVLEERDIPMLIRLKRELAELLRQFAPDLVHLNGIGPSALICHAIGNPGGTPFLVSLHQELSATQRGEPQSLLAQLLDRADWVHAVSPTVLEQACTLNPSLRERSSVIYNFVRKPASEPGPLPRDPPVLLCLGRVIPQKGFDVALEAFASLAERLAGLRLIIAGDGEDKSGLEKRAVALGLAERIEFTGWISPTDVPGLLNRCTVLVMPSRKEGFGVVAAEAAMMARPVVGSNCGGLRDVVQDGVSGLLVEKEDPRALADALSVVLEAPDRAAAMGLAGRERAIREFDLSTCIDSYEVLYRRLTGSREG
jgi:glycosyltransferase involved in cell wall biosynthesis